MSQAQLIPQQTIALDELRLLYSRLQAARERLLNKLYTVLGITSLTFTIVATLGALPAGAWTVVAILPSLLAVLLLLYRMWTTKGYEAPFPSSWDTLTTRHVEVSLDAAFAQIAINYCAAVDAEEAANQKLGRTVNWALIALLLQLGVITGLLAMN
jgi:hypothetical protein